MCTCKQRMFKQAMVVGWGFIIHNKLWSNGTIGDIYYTFSLKRCTLFYMTNFFRNIGVCNVSIRVKTNVIVKYAKVIRAWMLGLINGCLILVALQCITESSISHKLELRKQHNILTKRTISYPFIAQSITYKIIVFSRLRTGIRCF